MSSRSRRPTAKAPDEVGNLQQIAQVVPQPLPEQWRLGPFSTPGCESGIAIQIHTLNGTQVHFLTKEFALRLSEQLRQYATATPTIVIPTGNDIAALRAAAEQESQSQQQ